MRRLRESKVGASRRVAGVLVAYCECCNHHAPIREVVDNSCYYCLENNDA